MSITLPISDIISYLNEVGISAKAEDLAHPEERITNVHSIYEKLILLCYAITKDEIGQATFTGLQSIKVFNLHEESIPRMNFLRILQKLFNQFGISDFNLNDIVLPVAKRFRIHLSYAVNFLKYRIEVMTSVEEFNIQTNNINKQLEKSKQLKAQKENILQTKILLQKDATDEKLSLENECLEYENKITELNIKQAEIRENSTDLKNRNNRLKEEVSRKTSQLEELLAHKKQLENQIVSSPDKLRQQLASIADNLQQQQSDILYFLKKTKDINSWFSCIASSINDISNTKSCLESYSTNLQKQQKLINSITDKENLLISNKNISKEIIQSIALLERKNSMQSDKCNRMRHTYENSANEASETINTIQQDILTASSNRTATIRKAEVLEREAANLKKLSDNQKASQEQVYYLNYIYKFIYIGNE